MTVKELKKPDTLRFSKEVVRQNQEKRAKPLPRRCVYIRRTLPEKGVEKTELRFVVYKDPLDKFDVQSFLDEVGHFLREKANEVEEKTEPNPLYDTSTVQKKKGGAFSPRDARAGRDVKQSTKRGSREKDTREYPSSNRTPTKATDTTKNSSLCIDESLFDGTADSACRPETLRKAVPVIKDMIICLREKEEKCRNPKEFEPLRKTAENVLKDCENVLERGGTCNRDLVCRIKRLNQMSAQIMPCGSPTQAKSSQSCVNACSITMSETTPRP